MDVTQFDGLSRLVKVPLRSGHRRIPHRVVARRLPIGLRGACPQIAVVKPCWRLDRLVRHRRPNGKKPHIVPNPGRRLCQIIREWGVFRTSGCGTT